MFHFRWITLSCLGHRLSKHKITICSKHVLGGLVPLDSWLRLYLSYNGWIDFVTKQSITGATAFQNIARATSQAIHDWKVPGAFVSCRVSTHFNVGPRDAMHGEAWRARRGLTFWMMRRVKKQKIPSKSNAFGQILHSPQIIQNFDQATPRFDATVELKTSTKLRRFRPWTSFAQFEKLLKCSGGEILLEH